MLGNRPPLPDVMASALATLYELSARTLPFARGRMEEREALEQLRVLKKQSEQRLCREPRRIFAAGASHSRRSLLHRTTSRPTRSPASDWSVVSSRCSRSRARCDFLPSVALQESCSLASHFLQLLLVLVAPCAAPPCLLVVRFSLSDTLSLFPSNLRASY